MKTRANRIAFFTVLLWLVGTGNAPAALMSIEASYNSPGGGSATVTGIFDNAGFSGNGQEIFNFSEATFAFSENAGFLSQTSHTVFDMFGILFVNGIASDLTNFNNVITDPGPNLGKSKKIFNPLPAPNSPGALGIYMSDFNSQMYVEGWWVVNHQAPERHFLNGFSAPMPVVSGVPIPATLWLFGTGLIGLVGFGNRAKAA